MTFSIRLRRPGERLACAKCAREALGLLKSADGHEVCFACALTREKLRQTTAAT